MFPELFSIVAMWVVFAYFALGIFLNAISRSKPERYVMVPVTIVLTVLSFFLAISRRRARTGRSARSGRRR